MSSGLCTTVQKRRKLEFPGNGPLALTRQCKRSSCRVIEAPGWIFGKIDKALI